MQDELLRIWAERRVTVMLVTHDVEGAVYLSDTVVVMEPRPGRILSRESIDLARPRDRTTVAFATMKQHVAGQLRR